jgi:hypothetical protein
MDPNARVTFCSHEGYVMGTVDSVDSQPTLSKIKGPQVTMNCRIHLIDGEDCE